MRPGELFALTENDIDLEEGFIDVNKGIIPIKLLKNSSGFQIYNFAAWGSDVLKYAGKRNIHIRVKFPNGSMQGKVFFDFC